MESTILLMQYTQYFIISGHKLAEVIGFMATVAFVMFIASVCYNSKVLSGSYTNLQPING